MPDKPKRHSKNRNAAQRVESQKSGQTAVAGSSGEQEQQRAKSDFELVPLASQAKVKRQRNGPRLPKKIAMETPYGKKFVHQPGLPPSATPGVSAFDALFKAHRPEMHRMAAADNGLLRFPSPGSIGGDLDDGGITIRVKAEGPSRHYRRRVAQHHTWRDIVIPELVRPFLARKYAPQAPPGPTALCYCRARALKVQLVDWHEVTPTTLYICSCRPAAEQLLAMGFFPSAPRRPSLAFSLVMLEFITLHSMNVAPNVTAWASTLQQYWARRHMVSNQGETFRKRLGTALKSPQACALGGV